MLRVVRHLDPRTFFNMAREWLLEEEALNNIVLGLESQVIGESHPFDHPLYFATIENLDGIVGCAFRTPPFKLGLTEMPAGAAALVAEDVASVYPGIPAVLGSERCVVEFAKRWDVLKNTGHFCRLRMRIFALEHLIAPERPSAGSLRPATRDDLPLVSRWAVGFGEDTHLPGEMTRMAPSMVEDGSIFLWEDDHPRSMVGARGKTPNGIRISYVYTPPEERGKGYASTSVAELTRRQLAAGRRFCFLYTDQANPTSNAIYQRLGYHVKGEVVDVGFDEVATI